MTGDLPLTMQPRSNVVLRGHEESLEDVAYRRGAAHGYNACLKATKAVSRYQKAERLRTVLEAVERNPTQPAAWFDKVRDVLHGGSEPVQTMPPKMSRQERDEWVRRLRGGGA